MKLLFQSERILRTTTRSEWRKIDRWRRVTQRELTQHEGAIVAEVRKAQNDIMAFGSATIRQEAVDRIINPPLMIYPAVAQP